MSIAPETSRNIIALVNLVGWARLINVIQLSLPTRLKPKMIHQKVIALSRHEVVPRYIKIARVVNVVNSHDFISQYRQT